MTTPSANPRSGVRKLVFVLSLLAIASGLAVAGGTVWAYLNLGQASVITASLLATSLFFFSVAFVLYIMSKQPPPLESAADGDAPAARKMP